MLDLLGKLEGQPAQFSSKTNTGHKTTPPTKKRMMQENTETENRDGIKMHKSKDSDEAGGQKLDNITKVVKADRENLKEESRHEVLKRLLSGGEGKPSLTDTVSATNRTEEEELWSGADSKRRPNSGRLTGLRGEILSAGEERHGSVQGGELETSEKVPSKGLPRPQSGRTSGLRGKMMSMQQYDERTLASSRSAPGSGRTTGLRGKLTQQDDKLKMSRDIEGRGPRLHTAVLAHGHRPLLLGVRGQSPSGMGAGRSGAL